MALRMFTDRLRLTPQKLESGTQAPVRLAPANIYPDKEIWTQAYDTARDKADEENKIYWEARIFKDAQPHPLTVYLSYKWANEGKNCERKEDSR